MNQVFAVGNLGRDPEIKYLSIGQAVCNFSIASSRKFKKKDATEATEETTWLDCECWGKTAEIAAEYLAKGKQVAVVGRLRQEQWDDKETGKKRSKLKLVIEELKFLGSRGDAPPKTDSEPAPEGDVPF